MLLLSQLQVGASNLKEIKIRKNKNFHNLITITLYVQKRSKTSFLKYVLIEYFQLTVWRT